jgi:aliphatic nitrilase
MGDRDATVRVAAIQAASVFLDREASTAKACELIGRAGDGGARLIAFPEGFIPAHPVWFHFHPATGKVANDLSVALFQNAVEIPGPEITLLQQAAAEARAYVVVGVCERRRDTFGTLYNTLAFLGPDGALLNRHQKLVPTVGERLVHAPGEPRGLMAVPTSFGPASALICGENSNPLAIATLIAQYTRVHVMSWPNHFPTSGLPLRQRVMIDSQAFAQMSKAFVVSACGTMDDQAIERLQVNDDQAALLKSPDFCGGSVIVAPNSRVIAGPLGPEEDILYADLDLELGVRMKLRHDFAGHYNRPDVFQLSVHIGAMPLLDLVAPPAPPVSLAVPGDDGRPAPGIQAGRKPSPALPSPALPSPATPEERDGVDDPDGILGS